MNNSNQSKTLETLQAELNHERALHILSFKTTKDIKSYVPNWENLIVEVKKDLATKYPKLADIFEKSKLSNEEILSYYLRIIHAFGDALQTEIVLAKSFPSVHNDQVYIDKCIRIQPEYLIAHIIIRESYMIHANETYNFRSGMLTNEHLILLCEKSLEKN